MHVRFAHIFHRPPCGGASPCEAREGNCIPRAPHACDADYFITYSIRVCAVSAEWQQLDLAACA